MLDISVAYNRYRFLGNEFLTWLWFVAETGKYPVDLPSGEDVELRLGSRVVLENHRGEAVETITIKARGSELEEGRLALRKGAVVTELSLNMVCGGRTWMFDIKGESLALSGVKIPEPEPGGPEDGDVEAVLLDRIWSYEKALEFVAHMYGRFIRLRVSGDWERKTVVLMRKWMASFASA